MIMEDEGATRQTTHSKDSHYQLSKKVATLTKVIVRLVAANENYEQEINEMKTDAAARLRLEEELGGLNEIKNAKTEADERRKVLDAEMRELQEIKHEKAAVDEQLITLRQELQEARAFEAKHATQEKESIELLEESLESVKREAKEATELLDSMKGELEELKYEQEREKACHAQLVQEQLRQHDENVLRLRNELAEEHNLRMQTLREEMATSHVDEINLLKSRHEKNIVHLRYEASENEKLAIENAVARLRLEYEGKLSQQLASTIRKSEEIKAESQIALATLNKAKQSLEGELEKLKLRANEIPILKEKIDIHIANEEKLQTQVTRLEMSLDSMSSTNSEVVQGLDGEIDKLREALNDARETSGEQSKQIGCLEVEKSSLTSDLETLQLTLDRERRQNSTQRDEFDFRLRSLKIELEDYMTVNKSIVEQLLMATAEITILNKYKYCVQETMPPFLKSFKNIAAESKNDITELTQLFTEAVGRFVEWKERLISMRVDETSEHNENNRQLLEQIAELRSAIEVANNLNSCLEKKIEVIEDSHRHASADWQSYKMSLEKAQEKIKEHNLYEANKLGIHIADLKSTMTKLAEDHEYEYQKVLLDCQNQKECYEAALSRLRHDSTIEIQVLSQQLVELNAIVSTKKGEIIELVNNLDSMKHQQVVEQSKQRHELESLSKSHRNVLDERERIHEELRQKYGEILLSEHEKEYQYVIAQKQITELKRQLALERNAMITKVSDIKSQLVGLRSSTIQQVGTIKQEWKSLFGKAISTKLNSIKQTYDAICNKQRHELEQQRMSDLSSSKRLAVAEKECRDAKAMVFNTVRESEMKLERAIRHLSDDHALQLEVLSNQSKLDCDMVKVQLERMSKERELQSSAIATFTNIVTEKENEINELKSRLADFIRLHEDEIRAKDVQHEADRLQCWVDSNKKTTASIEKNTDEKSSMETEIQTQIDAVKQQLISATQLNVDLREQIFMLQANTSEINEKMLYYKRELEKRETSYDKAFFPKGTTNGGDQGLRVSQRGNEESKNGRINSRNSSIKGRGNSVAGTTKKLPKII